MKKTLFLTHILAAVISCSSFLHAQEENSLVEPVKMNGNQTMTLIADDVFPLRVTGMNNWLKLDNQFRPYVTFTYQDYSSIVNGELSLEKVKISPQFGNERWEMGANSRLSLGGTDVALVWFNITGPSVVFDDGVINLWENQSYTLGGNMGGTAGIFMKGNSRLNLGGKTLANPVTMDGSASIGNGTHNGALEVKAGQTLTLSGDLGGSGTISLGDKTTLNLNGKKLTKDFVWSGDLTIGNGTVDKAMVVKDGMSLTLCGDLSGTGAITMESNSTLDLAFYSIAKDVNWAEKSSIIGAGTIQGRLILKNDASYIWANKDVQLVGGVILGSGSRFDLNGQTIGSATLTADSSVIFNGTIADNLILANGVTAAYTWSDQDLRLNGGVTLGANAKFDLNGRTVTTAMLTADSSVITNGIIADDLALAAGASYTWSDKSLQLNGGITLGENSFLDLDGKTIKTATLAAGGAVICNGTITENLLLTGGASYTWGSNNLLVYGTVILGDAAALGGNAVLDLGGDTLSRGIIVVGNATLKGDGTFNGNAEVKGGTGRLALQGVTLGDDATFSMGDGAQLDLCEAGIGLGRLRFMGQSAVVDNGSLTVAGGETLTLGGNLSGTATVTLGDKATLDLGGKTLSNSVSLAGDATMGGGGHSGSLTVKDGKTLNLNGDLSDTGEISGTDEITLGDNAMLNLNGHTLGKSVILEGSASIGGGTHNGTISVAADKTLILSDDMRGSDSINLEDGAALNLGGHTLDKDVTLKGAANLAGGTIGGNLILADGVSYTWTNDTLQLTGGVTLGANTQFDLNGKTINAATLAAGSADIDNGTISGNLILANGVSYTWGDSNNLHVTGTVTLGDKVKLSLLGATLANDVIVQGTATLDSGTLGGGGTITGGTIIKTGAYKLDMKAAVSLNRLDVRQGVATVTGTAGAKGSIVSIQAAAGSTIELVHTDASWAQGQAYQGNLVIGDGSTVTASGGDGWAYRTKNSLTVKTGGKLDMSAHRWTLTAVNKITLAGGEITGQNENRNISLDFCGGANVVAVTEDSTLSAAVRVRAQGSDSLAFDVAEGKELAFTGGIVSLGQFDDSKATVYKRGAGTVVMSGANGMTNGTIIVEAGTLKVSGGANPLGSGTVNVLGGAKLALGGNVSCEATVNLNGDATLDLGGNTLDKDVTLKGAAFIENGTISGNLTLEKGVSYTWTDDRLQLTGDVTLEANTQFNMGGHAIKAATLDGIGAAIANGTVSGNLTLAVGVSYTWGTGNDLHITGTVTLKDGASLNLGGNTVTQHIIVNEDATLAGEGTFNGNAEVKARTGRLALQGVTLGDNATISLGNEARLYLCGAEAGLGKLCFTGQSAVVDNGTLTVAGGETLTLGGNLSGTATVTLGNGTELNLGGKSLSNGVIVSGDVSIGNGVHSGSLTVQDGKTLTLCDDLGGTGEAIGAGTVTLGDNATLKLNGHTLGKAVTLKGTATIGGGTHNGTISVGAGQTLSLNDNLNGADSVILEGGAALNLGGYTLGKDVTLKGAAAFGGGTLSGNLILADGVSYTWTDNTLQLTGGVTLGANAKFDLNGKSITTATLTANSAVICNGTIDENLLLAGGASYTWGDSGLDINGTVILGEKVKLDLNGGSIASATLGANNATITNGTVGGNLGLADGVAYTWTDTTLKLTGGVTLGANSRLDLNGNTINAATLTAAGAGIENGTVGGSFTLADNAAFTWSSNSLHIKGAVTLRNNAVLDLGGHTLDQPVRLEGSATIGNGTIAGTLTVDCGKTLTLNGDPKAPLTLNQLDVQSGGITVTGAAEAKVSIGSLKALEETTIRLVHTDATTAGDTVYNGNLVIGEGSTVTAGRDNGWGGAYHDLTILKGGKLDLGDHSWKFTMYNKITLAGGEIAGRGNDKDGAVKFTNYGNVVEVTEDSVLSARVCVFGNENSVEFNVHEGKELAFSGDIVSIGGMIPDDKAVIFKTGAGTMVMSGSNASANSTIIVQAGTLKVSGDADPLGTGTVGMAGGRLDLGGTQASLDKFMFEVESAVVDNGTLTVAEGTTVALGANLSGTGSNISLGDNAVLDLAGKTLSMNVSVAGDATIGGGTQNGAISVAAGKTLTLGGNLNGTGAVTLDNDSTLDFGGKILSKDIVVAGEATVKNGVINNAITIPGTTGERPISKLWLGDGVTIGENATFTMGDGAKLDLLWKTAQLSKFTLEESATAQVFTGWLYVGEEEAVTLNPNLIGSYELKLQGGTLDLGAGTLARKAIVTGHATMGNGTIGVGGSVIVNGGAQAHFSAGTHISGGAVTAGKTAIKALKEDTPGLLQELSVSEGHILGTGRAASLADGLYIKSEADLLIESMTLTANNEIHVGDNTITLKDVTIKMSDDICELRESTFYFNLQSLINCDLVMENVLLDASDLILPEGFDPATTSVVFDFGDDVTIKQATGLDMRLGNYWSPSMNLDEQGKVIFTKLVDTPEPTTSTLSLLALAALAARRRRR